MLFLFLLLLLLLLLLCVCVCVCVCVWFLLLTPHTLPCSFVIKAKIVDKESGKARVTMTFEVCRLDRMDLRGLRLTRVKGDTWEYKKVCNELLSQMRL